MNQPPNPPCMSIIQAYGQQTKFFGGAEVYLPEVLVHSTIEV